LGDEANQNAIGSGQTITGQVSKAERKKAAITPQKRSVGGRAKKRRASENELFSSVKKLKRFLKEQESKKRTKSLPNSDSNVRFDSPSKKQRQSVGLSKKKIKHG
jgi:hypothetical protein